MHRHSPVLQMSLFSASRMSSPDLNYKFFRSTHFFIVPLPFLWDTSLDDIQEEETSNGRKLLEMSQILAS
jgi:hypothetical protein